MDEYESQFYHPLCVLSSTVPSTTIYPLLCCSNRFFIELPQRSAYSHYLHPPLFSYSYWDVIWCICDRFRTVLSKFLFIGKIDSATFFDLHVLYIPLPCAVVITHDYDCTATIQPPLRRLKSIYLGQRVPLSLSALTRAYIA